MEVLGNTASGMDNRGAVSRSHSFDYSLFASELFNRVSVQKSYAAEQDEGGIGQRSEHHIVRNHSDFYQAAANAGWDVTDRLSIHALGGYVWANKVFHNTPALTPIPDNLKQTVGVDTLMQYIVGNVDGIRVVAEGINLTNEPIQQFNSVDASRPVVYTTSGRTFSLGFSAEF